MQQTAVAVPPKPQAQCVKALVGSEMRCLEPGAGKTEWFKDCDTCPEMVVVPSGTFAMGSPKDEAERIIGEDQVQITITKPFAVGRFAVTRQEFLAFVTARGHKTDSGCTVHTGSEWKPMSERNWSSPGFTQADRHPVVCVNWNDAKAYVAWLSSVTGKSYRLLSDPEREYVARAGTTTPFWWGSSITPVQANYDGNYAYNGGAKGKWRQATVAVDSFAANPWGLYNVHGNVFEWTEDCGKYGDGTAQVGTDCILRVMRGGAWSVQPGGLRAAVRIGINPANRNSGLGFRVARTL